MVATKSILKKKLILKNENGLTGTYDNHKVKKSVSFSRFKQTSYTFSKFEYDRSIIKIDYFPRQYLIEELNQIKSEMIIHPDSKKYTRFY